MTRSLPGSPGLYGMWGRTSILTARRRRSPGQTPRPWGALEIQAPDHVVLLQNTHRSVTGCIVK